MTTLITGASGFIGGALVSSLIADNQFQDGLRLLQRTLTRSKEFENERVKIIQGDLQDHLSLDRACEGADAVYHCAGYAHAFSMPRAQEEMFHRVINFEGTRQLIMAAAEAGVKRFVFLSSVKAMGEGGDICIDEAFEGQPETAYGRAKRNAENAVHEIGQKAGMHTVCLRLAMVYGPGGKGNLERMAAMVKRGFFPPLPETGNKRSLIYINDVVRAMRCVASDSRAAGHTYIVADPVAYSGRQIYDALRGAVGLGPARWAVPAPLLWGGGLVGDLVEALTGKHLPLDTQVVDRLLGSACYSPARIEKELGFRAETNLAAGLRYLMAENRVS